MSPRFSGGARNGTRWSWSSRDPMTVADCALQALHALHDREGSAHGALGVVLVGGRHPEDTNRCIAAELLDAPTVPADFMRRNLEELAHDVA